MTLCSVTTPLLLFLTAGSLVPAQAAAPQEAGPESRVRFFVGDWTFTGQLEGAPFAPDHPQNRVTEHCEMLGDVFVTCGYEIKQSTSSLRGLGIFGYDKAVGTYFFTSYDNHGVVDRWSAQVKGDTWSLVATSGKARTTWKELSPTRYHITIEVLQASGKWAAVMVGTYQK